MDDEHVDDEHVDDEHVDDEQAPEPEWKRRRRLAEIFGEELPATTADERDEGDGAARGGAEGEPAGERWLKAQVPPHHG